MRAGLELAAFESEHGAWSIDSRCNPRGSGHRNGVAKQSPAGITAPRVCRVCPADGKSLEGFARGNARHQDSAIGKQDGRRRWYSEGRADLQRRNTIDRDPHPRSALGPVETQRLMNGWNILVSRNALVRE